MLQMLNDPLVPPPGSVQDVVTRVGLRDLEVGAALGLTQEHIGKIRVKALHLLQSQHVQQARQFLDFLRDIGDPHPLVGLLEAQYALAIGDRATAKNLLDALSEVTQGQGPLHDAIVRDARMLEAQ